MTRKKWQQYSKKSPVSIAQSFFIYFFFGGGGLKKHFVRRHVSTKTPNFRNNRKEMVFYFPRVDQFCFLHSPSDVSARDQILDPAAVTLGASVQTGLCQTAKQKQPVTSIARQNPSNLKRQNSLCGSIERSEKIHKQTSAKLENVRKQCLSPKCGRRPSAVHLLWQTPQSITDVSNPVTVVLRALLHSWK